MRLRSFVLPLLVVVVLPACLDSPIGPACTPINPVITSQNDTITLATGLRYVVTTAGTGPSVQSCRLALIHYDLYVNDELIDSSREPEELPLVVTPGTGQLIPGFEQGIVGMRVGEHRRLIVPPNLGYGADAVRDPVSGAVIIPANSTLVFDVEVLEVEP